ncbi:pentapeptide repeat-containing protein [Rhizobium pusense]|uniref:pentapeptide repeat-containing protein n=1 Tax=Agrobacterium pusense TaxID=648995 RepID=UPI00244924F5|nr:pentapeptide repeat-containing protein [Agrobacterium pusense]MDH2091078.1 pentapeptide repeat-containing protein [Agrobacterium pusense]
MKFDILNRFSGEVQFSAEIDCKADDLPSVKLGMAVKVAVKESANLYGANLYGADLRSANLYGANLYGANLYCADLRSANLYGANLRSANLYGADLRSANLYGANLYCADLRSANLYGANLRSANLKDAKDADLVIAQTRILPAGSLIGWKKCRDNVIVKLRIPEEARRSHAFGRKCRAEFADVIEIIGAEEAISSHDGVTVYRAGERVTPDSFDDNWQEECASGIHFFITKEEAENY